MASAFPLLLFSGQDTATIAWSFLTGTLPSSLTFTRNGNATRVDETGKIAWAPANMMLYSVGTGGGGAVWVATGDATGSLNAIGIDGLTSASTITKTNVTDAWKQSVTVTPLTTYTFHFSVKKGTEETPAYRVYDRTGAADIVSSTNYGGSINTETFTKVSVTFTAPAGCVAVYLYPVANTAGSTGTTIITALQLEPTSHNSPLAYNPTTTAAYYSPRFDYDPVTLACRGLLLEGARTNLIRNNSTIGGVGGSPGTLPTGMSASPSGTGLTRTLSYGTEYGMPFMDIQLAGTPITSAGYKIYFEGSSSIAGVLTEAFTNSLFSRVSAGSQTNITSIKLGFNEVNSGSAYQTEGSSAIAVTTELPSEPFSFTRTILDVDTAFVVPYINITGTVGQPQDITLRIYLPQCEKASTASSRIPTTTAAVTRNADSLSTTALSWFNPVEGTFVFVGDNYGQTLNGFMYSVALSGNDQIGAYLTSTQAALGIITKSGVSYQTNQSASVGSSVFKHALSYKTGDNAAAINGTLQGDDASPLSTAPTPAGLTTLLIGNRLDGVRNYFGHAEILKYYNTRKSDAFLQSTTR